MSQTLQLTVDKETGILYRENTFDRWILNETRGYFPLGIQKGETILDIGGHIGCFASRARLENQATRIVSVEPELSNYEVLSENARKFRFIAIDHAVVDDSKHDRVIPLYVNTLKNNALHTLLYTRGRPSQEVVGYGFSRLLFTYEPKAIKCDIEGGEFDLPWDSLKDWPQIRMVIMELHLSKKGYREKAKELVEKFAMMGFRTVRKPKIGEKNWTTLARWER